MNWNVGSVAGGRDAAGSWVARPSVAGLAAGLLAGSLLVALQAHTPPARSEELTPGVWLALASSPGAALVDAVSAHVALGPDLAFGNVLLLVALAALLGAWLRALALPPALAVCAGAGAVFSRAAWSSAAPGGDAVVLACAALLMCVSTVRPVRVDLAAGAAVTAVVHAPFAAWLLVPLQLVTAAPARARIVAACGVWLAAVGSAVVQAFRLAREVPCAQTSTLSATVWDIVWPAAPRTDSWLRNAQDFRVIVADDIHLAGVALGLLGFAWLGRRFADVARFTLPAGALALFGGVAGMLPPGTASSLLHTFWLPWATVGLAVLWSRASGAWHVPGRVTVLAAALGLPIALHAVYVPDVLHASRPHISAAFHDMPPASLVAATTVAEGRRARQHGRTAVPADRHTVAACRAGGMSVLGFGDAIARLHAEGAQLLTRPIALPLSDIVADLRTGTRVGVAVTPTGAVHLQGADLHVLAGLGLHRDASWSRTGVGAVGRLASRMGASKGRDADAGDVFSAPPFVARADEHEASVQLETQTLARSAAAAIVVLDPAGEPALQGAAAARTRLPVTVVAAPRLSRAVVSGFESCDAVASDAWHVIDGPTRRLGVVAGGASERSPLIVYASTVGPALLSVPSLRSPMARPAWTAEYFDRDDAVSRQTLESLLTSDGIADPTSWLTSRHVHRLAVHPHGAAHARRLPVDLGSTPERVALRLVDVPRRQQELAVCRMAFTGPLLLPPVRFAEVDDSSDREPTVHAVDGWHDSEQASLLPYRWSGSRQATTSFDLESPVQLLLRADASPAVTEAVPNSLRILLNGTVLVEDIDGRLDTFVPREFTRSGTNTLTFEAAAVVPAGGAGHDPRPLAAVVRMIRIIPEIDAP